jgi:hypothetical protein
MNTLMQWINPPRVKIAGMLMNLLLCICSRYDIMKLQYFFAVVGTSRYLPYVCIALNTLKLMELISPSILGILLFFDCGVSVAK